MHVLGISAFYHDSAAALLSDGQIIAAAQEERFTRIKHDARFPEQAVRYCLREAGVSLSQIDHIVFFEKPFLKFERLLETYLAFAPRGFASFAKAMPIWLREKLFQKKVLMDELTKIAPGFALRNPLLFSEHHLSHAASAFFPSPFDKAAVLTLDGVGEWATTTIAMGDGHNLTMLKEIHFPHSLGLLYSAFTYYCGFKVNSGEYKLMGLAPYGEPRYVDLIRKHLIHVAVDGSFKLNLDYFDYCTGLRMTNARFNALFGGPARKPDEPLTQQHMDLAASIQVVTEDVVLAIARHIKSQTGVENLCLAGGVALNCVANGKLQREKIFRHIWIQPAAGDAGGSLGAALATYHIHMDQPRIRVPEPQPDAMQGALLGPEFSASEIRDALRRLGAQFEELDEESLITRCAQDLASGLAFGWFQGRMEFGPRALGSRSIIADARSPVMQSQLNLKVKFRESFRPFAPMVLAEHASEWFELDVASPYMLLVAPVLPRHRLAPSATAADGLARVNEARSGIPAVTHVDYSARVQTVHAQTNPKLHQLLTKFQVVTGVPILVNTSFNVRGEPIVCTPAEAFRCFMGTYLDRLVLGNFYLRKDAQSPELAADYAHLFAAD
jgi:carbamoyltransferase